MDTKESIKRQFMKEYGKKEFSLITVKGLCVATPVARTTFYSYFNNTDEVCMEIENDLIGGLVRIHEDVSKGNYQEMDFSALMDETEKYIKENWSDIYVFLVRQPNYRFIRKWKDAIKLNFSRSFPFKERTNTYDAVCEMLSATMISAYTYWMEHPDTISTADIKPLIKRQLDSLVANL